MNTIRNILAGFLLALVALPASAQVNSHSDGSDGDLNGYNGGIDLSQAPPDVWSAPSPIAGKGIYDAAKWAVVFKYRSVHIGGTWSFSPSRSNAPVIWLVQGDVTIDGHLSLSGASSRGDGGYALGGPGGFAGSRSTNGSDLANSGRGPGGGDHPSGSPWVSGAGHATPGTGALPGTVYGNERIIPLIGGSGGSQHSTGGGGGGGAILIIAGGTVRVNGVISANGGGGNYNGGYEVGGSGGAIRIIANKILGGGLLQAIGGQNSGLGRIRLESLVAGGYTGAAQPNASVAATATEPQIFPDGSAPTIQIASIGGQAPGDDPSGNILAPDVTLTDTANVEVMIQSLNVPSSWKVRLRIVPESGDTIHADATFVQQNGQAGLWRASVTLPRMRFTAIVRASPN